MKRLVATALALAACGDDRLRPEDAGIDSPPDAPVFPPGCDYAEQSDVTNDYTISNFTSEVTNLTLADAATICARVDTGHFDPGAGTVDVDGFELTLAAGARLFVTLAGDASALGALEVQILEPDKTVVDRAAYLGTHVAFETALIAGTYQLGVVATNSADLAAPIDYKLRVAVDMPETRCPAATAPADYSEANDGAQSDGNDLLDVSYAPDSIALTAADDAPESSAITTTAGTTARIAGTSGDVDAADDFKDRDTYLITTGAHDQLAIRIDWTGDADFDFLLVPEDTIAPIASGATVAKTGPEVATFPVLPNTRYWLWVGSFDSSTGLPIDYDVTLCPAQSTP